MLREKKLMNVSNILENKIRISGFIEESIVDGHGIRFVVFTQGCKKRCNGCHNPETQPLCGGYLMDMEELVAIWEKNPLLKGITISGGEPFLQSKKCAYLARKAKKSGLDVVVYSGYYFEELIKDENDEALSLLRVCDVLIDGPFEIEKKGLGLGFKGSSNQRVINLNETLKGNKIILLND